jgi:pimeloyl-ACP methyl ester carboxylesterase
MNAFNHASTAFGDVTWAGQSTRHVKQALARRPGFTQERMRALWAAVSPCSYYEKIVRPEVDGGGKRVLLIYGNYDLTFPKEYSLEVVKAFTRIGLNFEKRVLPCGHYTTGETPYKYIDGWYMGSFVYRAFKALREEKAAGGNAAAVDSAPAHLEEEEEAVTH